MKNEAIIEQLLQIQDEQILSTPLDALNLSPSIYRSLWRSGVRTVRDVFEIWQRNLNVLNIGEQARCEILDALRAWFLSLPSFANPTTAEDPAETRGEASDCEPIHENQTKTYVITENGVLVNANLLQVEELRKDRAERWKNVSRELVSAKQQDYAPKNTFQDIGQEPDKISSLIRMQKKPRDGSVPISTEWREMSLYLLEKARTSRQVRTINCPICMALMLSIRFKEHLVTIHPQAFRELKKAMRRRRPDFTR